MSSADLRKQTEQRHNTVELVDPRKSTEQGHAQLCSSESQWMEGGAKERFEGCTKEAVFQFLIKASASE